MRLLILAVHGALATAAVVAAPTVILVSIDGARWDYPELHDAPFLRELATTGVRAAHLRPSYPSKTFPNHYTLVTGLRPESHGIVQNRFFDADFNAWFGIGPHPAKREGRWWGGEPIWLTAQRQGLRTASLFWPGASADIHGQHPTTWLPFSGKMTPTERVAQVLEWIDLPPEERPQFIALYFDRVDSAGHRHGPTAPETRAALRDIDAALRSLREALLERDVWADTTLVVTADHGMTDVAPDNLIVLDELIDLDAVDVVFSGAAGGLKVKPPADTTALVGQLFVHPHLHAYARADVPERLHYSSNPRIPDIVLVPDLGWHITTRARLTAGHRPSPGDHGYDPIEPDMGALFLATGPGLEPGLLLPPVDNVHVYPFLCDVLGIEPAPNDGDHRLRQAFRNRRGLETMPMTFEPIEPQAANDRKRAQTPGPHPTVDSAW